jgi:nicotinamide-nucleotide amidase
MKAEILTIGDELLRGEIVDTNTAFLAERLLRLDVETRFHATVLDDRTDIREAFQRAAARADVVLVSGGLGPTRDDLTIEVLGEAFGRKLVLHEPSLAALRAFFARFGREMAAINEKQAWFPEGAEVLENPIGTAPGCMLETSPGGALVFCMPGVPRELYKMMDEQVLPRISAKRRVTAYARGALLRTFGIGESNLDERLRDVALPPGVELGFRTQFPDNHVRPVARAATPEEADAKLRAALGALRERLGSLVYGEGQDTLEVVLGRLLAERGRTLATAESCTGGMIAELMTAVPGSSAYLRGGVVAYANTAKRALLGVPEALLAEHGAVSDPVARAMAEGARARFGTDYAVATTGIAGPTGGTKEKPVGLMYVALADASGTESRELFFAFDRERNRRLAAQVAMDWVRRRLLGEPLDLPRLGTAERPRA